MTSARKCCAQCFGDRGLEKNIIPTLSTETGTCAFCGSQNVPLVVASQLADVFGLLINIYEPDANGRQLVEWLRADWDMFYHPKMEDARAKELLAEVLDDGEIVRKSFSPSPKYQSDGLIRWETLRTELMHENRYFPAAQLDLDRLRGLLDHLQADGVPTTWYRARLQTDDPFKIDQMGAPPPRIASHGRANPAGIPYLYLGSTPDTAVAEIRPHTGEKACVAEFTLPDGLKLVDLRNPRRIVSPFVLTVEDEIGLLRSDIDFLERLGQELTRPVVPQGAPFDYVPSQYLCEYIKRCGYAGVIYRSSVIEEGINLALFNPALANAKVVTQYDIVRVVAEIQVYSARPIKI
jgi:hypothetical protein